MTIKIKQTGAVYTEGSSINSSINIGGSTTQVQFNDEGVFAGDSGLTYNKTTDALTITGDLAVNGGDLTTSAATFDLLNVTATTLNIGGAATTVEIGAATGTTSINNALTVDGNTTLGNAASDTTTIAGSLAVNGTSAESTNKITSTQTSFDLLNSTVTTLNIGGAATTVEIGAATGTTSINNALTVDGNTTLGNAASDTTTIAGSLAVNGTSAEGTNKITSTQTSFDLLNEPTTLNIGSTAVTRTINIATGAAVQTVNIGTGAAANIISVGSTTGGASLTLQAGTGNLALTGATTTTYTVGSATGTGTITLGQSTATNTINIGNANTTAGLIQTINIGAGTGVTSGKSLVTVGSTANASALILKAGTGGITAPNQPGFLATPTSAQANFATGSDQKVLFGTESFDNASNFASSTFTAPVTGKYILSVNVYLASLDTAATYYYLDIVTSNMTYRVWVLDPARWGAVDLSFYSAGGTVIADMDANDTAIINIHQSGGTAVTDIIMTYGGSYFSGYLLG